MMLERPEQLLVALIAEAVLGYPSWLLRRIGHPVIWAGRLIVALENRCNRGAARMARGALAAILLLVLGGGGGLLVEHLLVGQTARGWPGMVVVSLVATTGLAQRSLWDHVGAVAVPLDKGDQAAARLALSHVVGRDTAPLDEAGISAAAVETLAESFCDGVVAPAFWFALFGLPGLFAFKAISTADSMIGHRDARHELFGKASARLDDVLNWIPARLAGVLLCMAGGRGWRTLWRDGHRHLSPNAGWPESAMAGVLDVTLGGGAAYDGEWIARQTLGNGPRPRPTDLRRALHVYLRACGLLWILVGALAWLR